MAKHVIFLGAGASYTSGYPLAAGLRKYISSADIFGTYVDVKIPGTGIKSRTALKSWFSSLSGAIELFRQGGFGTVDEFSVLAGKQFPREVHEIKQLVGLILALHNPEELYQSGSGQSTNGFESSDYYPFIQRLFRESNKLRDDVVILTYNYDPYFEFLLDRAYRRRQEASNGKQCTDFLPQLTSGFANRDTKAILEGKGFCFLKLHGTCVLPPQSRSPKNKFLTYKEVFSERNEWLDGQENWAGNNNPSPTMYFPWELLDKKGEFVTQDEFTSFEHMASGNEYFQATNRTLYELCKAIWHRAQKEIVDATQISFIGLSMHEFLKPGLRYLFAERVRKFEAMSANDFDWTTKIVLANPGAWRQGEKFHDEPPPNSPVAKLVEMLSTVNPKMASKPGSINTRNSGGNAVGRVICYDDFKSFIEREM